MEESKVTPRYGAAIPGWVIFECPACKGTTQRLEGQPPPECIGDAYNWHLIRSMRAVR